MVDVMNPENIPYLISDQQTPTTVMADPLTEAQQEMLLKFKERLPSLINPDVTAHDDAAFCDDPCLKRYLRATKWNLEHSVKRLEATLKWRREFQPHKITLDSMMTEGATGKLHINGFDMQNHPILHLVPCKENTNDSEGHLKHVVFNLESAIKLLPVGVEKFVILVDLRNISARNIVSIGDAKAVNDVLSSHYVERVKSIFLCEAPWIFSGFFRVVSPLLDPVTKEKINFVNIKHIKQETVPSGYAKLSNYIDLKYIYKDFGGDNPFTFVKESYFNQLRTVLENAVDPKQ
ncbi:CRAL/TRIO domain-containing protein [Conidiobolus coronatus NRRL 28638]|uniref:CRAL/TRIO domain-containing protein n=1 Tax=Conidiobolus coronatus (strain ATCC 28846 / CBS 209.66 / NRRL 28638) TaxID=796925 RepID=A0A137P5W3_CONC2|nr:CRAL/TRIO domain-containing protein [Conidiobolus coronatus NRRL 28638]|eukprot:KXN70393.1 CRAL/TRIO domain-containing protein [Conidiobolus coronatus NRRL 28638]